MTQANVQADLIGAIRGCSSWQDIHNKWRMFPEKRKGDLFESLTKAYLQLEPEYASKLKNVWLHREVPQAIARRLKLPATDQGIDLVAQTNDGEFWAIQCKYRQDTDHSLTWRELSTFAGLAFGVCCGFSFGIICSTTERITRVLKDQDRIGFCALDVWLSLDADFLKRIRAHLAHKPRVLKPLHPRPHQTEAVKDAVEHFVTHKAQRGKLIMPCGSGKSLTAYWIAKKLGARRIVIAVPSLALIRQTLKVWLRETMANGQAVEWICVCSDESAGRIGRDDVAVLRQDLGVPCITNPEDIAAWLKRKHRGLTVVFTTYQSGEAISQAARSAKFRFDLGILDEAHKTVGDREKLFSHLLHDENLKIGRRIFMTATERRYQGQRDTVLSMDDPNAYGETFHLLSFKRAIEIDPPILSDYKIISIAVSREEVAELIQKNIFVRPDTGAWNKEIEADMLASLIALRKAMEKHPIRHAVSFHSSIQRATLFKTHNAAFSHALPRYGILETFHVSGKTPTGTRARIIGEFANAQRSLITNARCLTEGVDVPDIDCVLFADPRRSAVDIVQAVGRALRPAPGKEFGYVIVPILHDADATAEEIADSESFKEILATLRALAANDDRIIEYFRAVSQGQQRSGSNFEVEIDERLAEGINLEEFVREIELKCWDRLAKLSWRPFVQARAFARSLALKDAAEWFRFSKDNRPSDIPSAPHMVYARTGWTGYGDWLGTENIGRREYRGFQEARRVARGFGLRSRTEWMEFCKGNLPENGKLPADIPAKPSRAYADTGWTNWGDWLGSGTVAPQLRQFRSFEEARAYARGLTLKGVAEWRKFCRGKLPEKGNLPSDVPAVPDGVYADKGWAGYGDWLGTGIVAPHQRKYRAFKDARAFARSLGFKKGAEWEEFCRRSLPDKGELPSDIPAAPQNVYLRDGWAGMGDWLGTGRVASYNRRYRPFKEARAFAQSLGLKSRSEWRKFCKGELPEKGTLPSDIPAVPNGVYADQGWAGDGDWLGTGEVAPKDKRFLPLKQARAFARKLDLKSGTEWHKYCKGELPEKGDRPPNIPSNPNYTYKTEGWSGMGDWLGTGRIANRGRKYRPFKKARSFARGLNLKSGSEWMGFCRGNFPEKGVRPEDIPSKPDRAYADKGWAGMGDWLGTGTVAPNKRKYRPFKEARAFARRLALGSGKEWREFCNGNLPEKGSLPSDIPAVPRNTYAGRGWLGMKNWLGTEGVPPRRREFRPFKEARAFARGLCLTSSTEWAKFSKGELPQKGPRQRDIPSNPGKAYANKGWAGMGDWLGTGNVDPAQMNFRPFNQAREFVHGLGLSNVTEWRRYCRGDIPSKGLRPPDIPASPDGRYKDKGWAGYPDWLGTGKPHVSKKTQHG